MPDQWHAMRGAGALIVSGRGLSGGADGAVIIIRHKPVLKDILEPSCLRQLSGRNGGQFIKLPLFWLAPIGLRRLACEGLV